MENFKTKAEIFFLAIVAIGFIAYFSVVKFYPGLIKQTPSEQTSVAATTTVSVVEPTKTNFGTTKPADFPTNIPLEQGAKIEQSYSLDYPGQKQLTINFESSKTVKQNYDLYADFLKREGWNVSNKYESEKISSLYGTKENNEINITISFNEAAQKTKVSISVLKR